MLKSCVDELLVELELRELLDEEALVVLTDDSDEELSELVVEYTSVLELELIELELKLVCELIEDGKISVDVELLEFTLLVELV